MSGFFEPGICIWLLLGWEDCGSTDAYKDENTQSSALLPRFWSGMYNRFDKGLQPRQSVTDHLTAVKEETQQLEQELEALEEVRYAHSCQTSFCAYFSITAPWKRLMTQNVWNVAIQLFVFLASGWPEAIPPGELPNNWSPRLGSTKLVLLTYSSER